jgi:hypothetical protein
MSNTPLLNWLHDLPFLIGLALVCGAFVIPTLIGSYLLQPKIAKLLRGERDINTILLSIAVFENHNKAEDAVVREAVAIIKLYRDVHNYPEEAKPELVSIIDRYIDEAIGPGWILQAQGKANPREIEILSDFHISLGKFQPSDIGQGVRYAETLRVLDDFVEARRLRISAGTGSIPRIMWFVVLVGAVMNTILIWMFDLRPFTHAVIGGSLSLFVALVIYMIAVLDAPFKGAYGVKPTAISAVHAQSGMHR